MDAAIENYYHYYYNKKFHYNKFGIDKRLFEESQDKLYLNSFEHNDSFDLNKNLKKDHNEIKKLDDDDQEVSLEESIVKKLGTPPQSEDELNDSIDENDDRLEIDEEDDIDLDEDIGSENSDDKTFNKIKISKQSKLQINLDVSHLDENANCHLTITPTKQTEEEERNNNNFNNQRKIWNPLNCSSRFDQPRYHQQIDESNQSTLNSMNTNLNSSSQIINQNSNKSCSIVRSELAKLLLAPVTSNPNSVITSNKQTNSKPSNTTTKTTNSSNSSNSSIKNPVLNDFNLKTNNRRSPIHQLNFSSNLNTNQKQNDDLFFSTINQQQQSHQIKNASLANNDQSNSINAQTAKHLMNFSNRYPPATNQNFKSNDSGFFSFNSQNTVNIESEITYAQTPSFSSTDLLLINNQMTVTNLLNQQSNQIMPKKSTPATKLERRRIYKCSYDNCTKKYFKSSHLKCHYRVHTG